VSLFDRIFGKAQRDDSEQLARTANVMERLAFARIEMRKRGTRTLLDGRPAWQRINPMAVKADANKVVPLRKRK
jgi:hypothetical protein